MSKSRRKELKQNELKDGLERSLEWAKRNISTVLLVVVLFIAVLLAGGYYLNRSSTAADRQWGQLALANRGESPEEALRNLADRTSDQQVAAMALVQAGDHYYYKYIRSLVDTTVEQAGLKAAAIECYERVVQKHSDSPLAAAAARMGLAALAEHDGQIEAARGHYQAVEDDVNLEQSALAIMAKMRATQLTSIDSSITFVDRPIDPEEFEDSTNEGEETNESAEVGSAKP